MSSHALVVGGTGETGLAVVRELLEQGYMVSAVAREGRIDSALAVGARVLAVDLMADGSIERAIAFAKLPGAPDVIVHVIGGSLGLRDAMLPSEDWAKVWQLNVGIPHEINRALLPEMAAKGYGRIVHFSSNGVKLATGTAPYTSAKSAVEGYVRMMAKQFCAQGVVISAVAPGPIYTEGRFMYSQDEDWTQAFFEKYVPMKRWGNGEEIAKVVAFLCSDAASYMAGAIVPVDGSMR